MPRRRVSGLDLLIALPWYVGAAIAAVLYFGAQPLSGLITQMSPILAKSHQSIAGLLRILSYVVAGRVDLRAASIRRASALRRATLAR
jgi:hypothetical protein